MIARGFLERATVQRERFLEALRNGRAVQRDLLAKILARNADTVFGREHGFGTIRDLREYKQAVPLRSYGELRPYIDRALAGERNVLTAADPVLFFSTAGTTGAPKRVPVIREAFTHLTNNQLVYWASLGLRYPVILERDDAVVMLHLAPQPFAELSPAGVPILNPTHIPAEGNGVMPYARAPWFPPPPAMADAERLYFFLRRTIEHRLAGFVCLHPSRMAGYAARLAADVPRLVQELRDGTVCGRREGDPNPERAAELEQLACNGQV
ncbi:MAG TPA: GH3 auxin-responsive promoter family protein, partial [Kofleriaceae bacterium]